MLADISHQPGEADYAIELSETEAEALRAAVSESDAAPEKVQIAKSVLGLYE